MSTMRHQVILPYTSGFARDVSVNVWHSTAVDVDGADQALNISPLLAQFYNGEAIDPAGNKIANYLSPVLSRAANVCKIKSYDLADPEPRTPVLEYSFTLGASGDTSSLPYEVALCASFIGEDTPIPTSIRRRRGRVYLGPFNVDALPPAGVPAPLPALVAAIADASERLITSVEALTGDERMVVYSRVGSTPYPIYAGWVDNEFDTQRRRQRDATARTEWDTTLV